MRAASWALVGVLWHLLGVDAAGEAPRTAFMIVGAAYDVKPAVFERYKSNVIDAYAGTERTSTFVLVKALHFDGSPYSDRQVAALNETIYRTVAPAAAVVTAVDPTTARFGRATNVAAIDCIYPRPGVGLFSQGFTGRTVKGYYKDDAIAICRKRFMYWWGAMQLAWELVAEYEARTRTTFDRVIFLRAGVDLTEKMVPHTSLPKDFYTTWDPPDSFWVMTHRFAEAALTMADRIVNCTKTESCCVQMRACKFKWSWWIPCLLSHEMGIVPVILPTRKAVKFHGKAIDHTPANVCFPWDLRDSPGKYKKCAGPLFLGGLGGAFNLTR